MENERGTVERALRLISYVAAAEGDISIKSVADEMHLPTSTAHRLVQQLVGSGFLQRAKKTRTYQFGPAMYRLGASTSCRSPGLLCDASPTPPTRDARSACSARTT